MEKKIVVPAEMLKAAIPTFAADSYADAKGIATAILEAALYWLSENPMVPTAKQRDAVVKSATLNGQMTTNYACLMIEWQRHMFLAPEPEVPEEIRNLFVAEVSEPASEFNARVVEAYRLGQASKDRP